MVRKLDYEDNDKIFKLINEEPEFNIYIIDDIIKFGYNQDFLDFYGEFSDKNDLIAIMVRYFSIFNVYAKSEFNVNEFAKIMYDNEYEILSGKSEIVSKFENTMLKFGNSEKHHFAILKDINKEFKINKYVNVKKAKIEDIGRICSLRNNINEFSGGSSNFETLLFQSFENNTSEGYYIEDEGKLISYAQVSVGASNFAMIGSVMTDKEYRKKGLASACINRLCQDYVYKGKTLCLFYKNSEAEVIYKKIGFIDIGKWSMYKKG